MCGEPCRGSDIVVGVIYESCFVGIVREILDSRSVGEEQSDAFIFWVGDTYIFYKRIFSF